MQATCNETFEAPEVLRTLENDHGTPLVDLARQMDTLLTEIGSLRQVLERSAPSRSSQLAEARVSESALRRALMDAQRLFQLWAGQQKIDDEPFHPMGMVEQIAADMRPAASAKGLSLTVVPGGEWDVLTGPAEAIRQIVRAALDNAIKFTDRGRIAISLRMAAAKRLLVEVEDTGIGMPDDFRARAFQPFAQAARSAGWPQGGAGLGLAICCAWARAIGAEVGFESVEGKGTRFWLEVPVARLVASKPVVLVADDIDVNRMVARRFLEKLGMAVEEAASGLQAIEMAQSREYAMVIVDCSMPDMDGFAVAARIREESAVNRDTPIIAFSGANEATLRARIEASGMNGWLPKPVRREDFVEILERWVPAFTGSKN